MSTPNPKSLIQQALSFATMLSFCFKATGPQGAAVATGLSVLINIFWPNSGQVNVITPAMLKADLTALQKNLEAAVAADFKSTYQSTLDHAIFSYASTFHDAQAGNYDHDTNNPTANVNAADWSAARADAMRYAHLGPTNKLIDVWTWASELVALKASSEPAQQVELKTFGLFAAAAGCYLNWCNLGLFFEFEEIRAQVALWKQQGKKNATQNQPTQPIRNRNSVFFKHQLAAIDYFIAFAEGGTVADPMSTSVGSKKTFKGVLNCLSDGKAKIAQQVHALQQSRRFNSIRPIEDSGTGRYFYTDTKDNSKHWLGTDKAKAQTMCKTTQLRMEADLVLQIRQDHFMDVLTDADADALFKVVDNWKTASKQMHFIKDNPALL